MIEKENILFETSISFSALMLKIYLRCGIIGCIVFFDANPEGLSAVIFLLASALVFLDYKKIIIYPDRFLVVQKRIIDRMDSEGVYYYWDIENVEFREDNISWING